MIYNQEFKFDQNEQHHTIDKTTLNLAFDSSVDADKFTTEVSEKLIKDILPSIESMFNRLIPSDVVLRVHSLSIDLGNIESENIFDSIQEQLSLQLYEQVSKLLSASVSGSAVEGGRPSEVVHTQSIVEKAHSIELCLWQQAWHFLTSGKLEWPFRQARSLQETGLESVILDNINQLDRTISQSQSPESACTRLSLQLSHDTLALVLPELSTRHQTIIMLNLLSRLESSNPALNRIVNHAWYKLVSNAIQDQGINSLLPYWDKLFQRHSKEIIKALYKHAHNRALPHMLIATLSEAQRFALLERLETNEYPFLFQLLNTPQLWSSMVSPSLFSKEKRQTEAILATETSELLWSFTFHFILVDRGSRFNKQQYMLGLIANLAAEKNLKVESVVMMLRHTLKTTPLTGALKQQMLQLLGEIEAINEGDSSKVANQSFVADFSDSDINEAAPKAQSTAVPSTDTHISTHPDILRLVRQLTSSKLSHALIAELEHTLRNSDVCDALFSHFISKPKLREILWQSLPRASKRLLIEQFNQSRTRLSSNEDLTESPFNLGKQWQQLANTNMSLSVNLPLNSSLHQLLIALQQGSESSLKKVWPNNPERLRKLLVWVGQLSVTRQHWVEHYSNETLMSFTQVIEPAATPIVQKVFSKRALISDSLSYTAGNQPVDERTLHNSLWQYTLSYLLIERGSEFNNRSYLRSLTKQMSARYNVSHHSLLKSMVSALSSNESHRLRATLVDLIGTLEGAEAKDAIDIHYADLNLSDFSEDTKRQITTVLLEFPDIPMPLWSALFNADTSLSEHLGSAPLSYQISLKHALSTLSKQRSISRKWLNTFDDESIFAIICCMYHDNKAHIYELKHFFEQIHHASMELMGGALNRTRIDFRASLWKPLLSQNDLAPNIPSLIKDILFQLLNTLAKDNKVSIYQITKLVLPVALAQRSFHDSSLIVDTIEKIRTAFSPLPEGNIEQLFRSLQTSGRTVQASPHERKLIKQYLHNENSDDTSSLLAQLLQCDTNSVQSLVRQLNISVPPSFTQHLPTLCYLVASLNLSSLWFYQLLLKPSTPVSESEWVEAILTQLTLKHPSKRVDELRLTLLRTIKTQHQIRDQANWLSAAMPHYSVKKRADAILSGGKDSLDITRIEIVMEEQPNELWIYLSDTLQYQNALDIWSTSITAPLHLRFISLMYPHLAEPIASLYHALHSYFNSESSIAWYWSIVYRQVMLIGVTSQSSLTLSRIVEAICLRPVIASRLTQKHSIEPKAQLLRLIGISDQTVYLPETSSSNKTKAANKHTEVQTHLPKDLDPSHPAVAKVVQAVGSSVHQPIIEDNAISELCKPDNNEPLHWPYDKQETKSNTPFSVNNAGLVIASTYIPTLFQRLKLSKGQQFVDENSQLQALFCLQFLVDGTHGAPEYLLMLNKLVCGIELDKPIPQQMALPENAETTIEGLLSAMIAHWKAIGSTSIDGLRTTFLQREGILVEEQEHWQLEVLPDTFDMLLDQLPWSFQTIKYPWMSKPLFVTWR